MKSVKFLLLVAGVFLAPNLFAQTWTQTSAPTNNWAGIAMSADGTKIVAVAGDGLTSGPICTSTNSGVTWTTNTAPIQDWIAVCSSADGTRLAANAYNGGTWTNSGTTWAQTPSSTGFFYPSSIASSADGKILMAGSSLVYMSTNRGASWRTLTAPPSGEGCAMSADGTILLVNGAPYLSTNAGATWFVATNTQTEMRAAASSVDGGKLFAMGDVGLWVSTNSGVFWLKPPTAPISSYGSIAASADGTQVILARRFSNQPLYISTDSGLTWTNASAPSNDWSTVASSADGNTLAAAVLGGGIWVYHNTPAPALNFRAAGGGFSLFWTVPSTNFVLQGSADLSAWTDLTNQPVLNLTNLQEKVSLPNSSSNIFYRLATQ